jgi:hypothetical protein
MRCRARGLAMIAAVLVSLVGGVAVAQDKPAESVEALRDKLRADKRSVVTTMLELTDKEAAAFWPVYNAYQGDMIAHYDRIAKLLDTYGGAFKSMNDATANQLLGEFMAVQTSYLAIVTNYRPRFERVLPPRKVARLYQLENKIRALVDYEIAREIPLIK